jgi:phosphatidylglycerol:prolipoprotein diacylglycerol transferase
VIPFFINPLATVLPAPFNDSWGVLVCIGFVVGLEVARSKAIREQLDVRDVVDGIVAIVGCGFLFGHLVNTLVYHPEQMEKGGPQVLLQVWAGQSSFGGFLGAVIGSLIFYKGIRRRAWLQQPTSSGALSSGEMRASPR